jgi:Domain of unknown function (DUF4278)
MKLPFRRNLSEVTASIELASDSTAQPQMKLIYRGNTSYYTPRPVVVSQKVETEDRPTVTLIYRGNTYERKLKPPKPYQKPRAINWRWNRA